LRSLDCPHCEAPTRVRTSRDVAPTFRQLQLQCTNADCGATYGADITITHGISPSAIPNPAVTLRMVSPRRRLVAANDDGRFGASAPGVAPVSIANDNDGHGEAVATGG
jgi:hypothetical protein